MQAVSGWWKNALACRECLSVMKDGTTRLSQTESKCRCKFSFAAQAYMNELLW